MLMRHPESPDDQYELPRRLNTRYQLLDVFRGVACLMLVVYHGTFYADYSFRLTHPETWSWYGLPLYLCGQAWMGVAMFFVISGYCIAASTDRLRDGQHAFSDYFWKRFRRIYPPLWAMGIVAVLFTLVVRQFPGISEHCQQLPLLGHFSIWNWLGNFTATEGWMHHVTHDDKRYLMLTIWTLCYEEQFYLVTGLALAITPRHIYRLLGGITVGVLIARHLIRAAGGNVDGFFFDGYWMIFGAGALVYQAIHYFSPGQRRAALVGLALTTVYGAVDRYLAPTLFQEELSKHIFVGSLFAMLLIGLYPYDAKLANHWTMTPLRHSGRMSYSIYLTHYLFVVTLASYLAQLGFNTDFTVATVVVPICFVVSLPIAIAFYHLVEKRCLNEPTVTRPERQATMSLSEK